MQNLISKPASSINVITEHKAKLKVFKGEEVLDLLSDSGFRKEWDKLFNACPWSTVFQSRKYAAAWYNIYKEVYLPIVVVETCHYEVTGIFALARDAKGHITGVGVKQAEYHVWLTYRSNSDFVGNALHEVLSQFPGSKIELKYVPGTAPLDWINSDLIWFRRSVARKVKHPIIRIDIENTRRELKKKNRKEKINRLKRIGELSFERINDTNDFISIFDQIASQYDFRKEAMFNSSFFKGDPLRKIFLIDLFKENLLHVTVLKLNGDVIASNVAATEKKMLHLQGINSHDPFYGKYSPGILHLLFTCDLLAKEGVAIFDLTPGSDAYKDNLATDNVHAYHIIIGSRFDKFKTDFKYKITKEFKNRATQIGINPNALKQLKWAFKKFMHRTKVNGVGGLFNLLYKRLVLKENKKSQNEYSIWDKKIDTYYTSQIVIKTNSLSDLLNYAQQMGGATRWEFLEDAMRRLERGERAFTWNQDGLLLGCIWLSSSKPDATLPSNSALLQGLYIHPKRFKQQDDFLQSVAHKVSCEFNFEKVNVLN